VVDIGGEEHGVLEETVKLKGHKKSKMINEQPD